eukprot:2901434-Pleurochrysis_carterae.AAC.1
MCGKKRQILYGRSLVSDPVIRSQGIAASHSRLPKLQHLAWHRAQVEPRRGAARKIVGGGRHAAPACRRLSPPETTLKSLQVRALPLCPCKPSHNIVLVKRHLGIFGAFVPASCEPLMLYNSAQPDQRPLLVLRSASQKVVMRANRTQRFFSWRGSPPVFDFKRSSPKLSSSQPR